MSLTSMTNDRPIKIWTRLHNLIPINDSEDSRKRRLFILLAVPGISFLSGFGLFNIFAESLVGGWIDLSGALILLAFALNLHRFEKPVVLYRLSTLTLFFIMCFWTVMGGQSGEKILWPLIYPLMVFFLLGRREGLAWSAALLIVISLVFVLEHSLPVHYYPFELKLRVFFVYLASCMLTYVYEVSRQISQDKFFSEQAKLNAEKKKLSEATLSLQSANEALMKSEALLKHAQSIAHLGNWEYDYASRTFWLSEEIFNILGMKQSGTSLGSEHFQTLVPDFPHIANRITQTITQDLFLNSEFEVRLQSYERPLYLHVRAQLTRDEQGRPSKLTGVMQDITDRKAYEIERRELHNRLTRSQKMEALGLLAGGVAHDLNNVMLGIVTYPDYLLSGMHPDDKLFKPLVTIREAGQKSAAIVEDLLTLARRGVTTTDVLNLNSIVEGYLQSPEFLKLEDFQSGVRFHHKLDPNLFNVEGSAIHLKKTLMNLVSNAAEAIEGKGEVLITTTNCYVDLPIRGYSDVKEGEYIRLRVEDTGSGINEEDLNHVFEPFYTKKIMGRSGTGLGMAVVWGTVQDHKGYIDVQSCAGKGTVIDIYIPITREKIALTAKKHSRSDIQGNGEHILIIDDVHEQREVASQILESLGYNVHAVDSGEAAVGYLKEHSADLLVLDMIMDPGMDGLDTYKAILALHPDQKAVIVSGYSETGRVKAAQALGAGAYLKKPYVLETLGLAVKTELGRNRLQ
jgi:signal transduction histidine kinase/CheY-like chemotaxis protein